jgi:hypothetical protein
MALESTYCLSVAENTTVEISKEKLRSILSQIESELHCSEVYQRTLAGLQTMLGEAAGNAQLLVKAVGREAIRLAVGEFAKHYKLVPVPSPEAGVAKEAQPSVDSDKDFRQDSSSSRSTADDFLPDLAASDSNQEKSELDVIAAPAKSEDSGKPPSPTSTPPGFTKPPKKLTKTELAAQIASQERDERLRKIGRELQHARQAHTLTVRQLYHQTLVQPHHIQALELGRFDQLPEDVYVRGFIRLLGDALGLDGAAMAASLPAPDPVKSVVPSWQRAKSAGGLLAGGLAGGFQLSPVHLYLGYTALVAGAVGGLSLMSQPSTAGGPIEPNPAASSHSSASGSNQVAETAATPGLKYTKIGVAVAADIAPPELILLSGRE